MSLAVRQRLRQFGGVRAAALVLVFTGIVGATLAYRYFANRPGESAIQLIPGDAMMVVTIDFKPSERQVGVFKRIGDALKQEGLDAKFDETAADAMDKSPVVREMRPYLNNSFAMGLWENGTKESGTKETMVALFSLKDAAKAKEILAKNGTATKISGLECYNIRAEKAYAAIIAEYVVVSDTTDQLLRVQACHTGQTASVVSLPEYQ